MQTTILSREAIRQVVKMEDVLAAVEEAYRQKALGKTDVWPLISYDFTDEDAVMDIRSGCLKETSVHGLKLLNNFPRNADAGIPVFTGVLMLFDSHTGLPLGIMDASYITSMRTGAAGALGIKHLARKDAKTLLLIGTGNQAIFQVAATLIAVPGIQEVLVFDPRDAGKADRFSGSAAQKLHEGFGIDARRASFEAVHDLAEALSRCDAAITITRAREPIVKKGWVAQGTHFSCVGADMEGKEEIDPLIFAGARVFCDDIEQAVRVGECEVPIKQGILREEGIAGEIGALLAGEVEGRASDDDITVFDATGLAILDLVTARIAVDAAREAGLGAQAEI